VVSSHRNGPLNHPRTGRPLQRQARQAVELPGAQVAGYAQPSDPTPEPFLEATSRRFAVVSLGTSGQTTAGIRAPMLKVADSQQVV
jgi:hypothetical protein